MGALQELDAYLEQQSLDGIFSGNSTQASASKDIAKKKDPFWWGLLWFRKRRRDSTAAPSTTEGSPTTCPWLGELQYISNEVEPVQQWADYEVELTAILGLDGGRDAIVARLPALPLSCYGSLCIPPRALQLCCSLATFPALSVVHLLRS